MQSKFVIRKIIPISAILMVFVLPAILSACSLVSSSSEASLQETLWAMSAQGTALALQATQAAINVQATLLAQQATQIAGAAQPIAAPPVVSAEPPAETITSTQAVGAIDAELEEKIKTAKILLFEDISGNHLNLLRYVKEALDSAGFSYVDVGSAHGWFKDKLISDEEWDLIIMASELSGRDIGLDSGRISGEFFDYLNTHLDKGTAVIMEMWTLNKISQGSVRKILDRCGVRFQSDWLTPPTHSVWFLIPEHPIFHEPNEIGPSLRDYGQLWKDSGDLMMIREFSGEASGDATLLAGTQFEKKNSHGVLAVCQGGRLIIQTFASHHHNQEDIVRLWQNYIYYTLKNHFLYLSTQ